MKQNKTNYLKTTLYVIVALLLILVISNSTAFITFDAKASTNDRDIVKYYASSTHKDEISNFTNVNDSKDSDIIFVDGYNYVFKQITQRPDKNSTYNDIDTVIYMINQLESIAEEYWDNVVNLDENYDDSLKHTQIKNYVLGYLRGINKDYTSKSEHEGTTMYDQIEDDYGLAYWHAICGAIDISFVDYVKSRDTANGNEITFPEFFASFIQTPSNYNSFLYDDVEQSYLEKKFLLTDPLGSAQGIDLIHLFASLDAVYEQTEKIDYACIFAVGNTHYQKDLASWLGDLEQFTADISKMDDAEISTLPKHTKQIGHIDFNSFVRNASGRFSSEDLLSDIDANNVAKFYLDDDYNSLSSALTAYYTTINSDSKTVGNRYYEFIYSVTLQVQTDSGDMLTNFQSEVFNALNVDYNNGNPKNYEKYKITCNTETDPETGEEIVTPDYPYQLQLMIENDIYPSVTARIYCAQLFYDYIINMSNRF